MLAVERKGEITYNLNVRGKISLSVLIAIFLCGCTHDESKRGHGEVGDFVLQQTFVLVPNAQFVLTNNLPKIGDQWRYSQDQYGVVIRLPKDHYPALTNFLGVALGKPRLAPDLTNEFQLGVYRLTAKGGAIQYERDKNFAQIIIIRPLTEKEFSEGLTHALQNKEF